MVKIALQQVLEKPNSISICAQMLRLYQPCLPTRSAKAPTGPLWIHKIKHDGFRIVARRINGRSAPAVHKPSSSPESKHDGLD